ncbi:MAG: outer membrane protein assembly factor BamE [Alphaproteobacteria bacterium]|nr:outer membrane protein assembly factor BamE [Alphaproteobacteria bacterium]
MKKSPVLLFSLLLALSACQPIVANRGSMLDEDMFAQIKPGETTREDVATTLGSPTSVSSFDENVWYYIGRETEQYSFLDPEVLKQQVVEVDFDDNGVVTEVKNLELAQAEDISPVDRETPSYGQNNTLLRELIGDLKHTRPGMGNNSRSGR